MRIEPNTKLYDIARSEGVITAGDNLAPPEIYIHRKTSYIETAFNIMLSVKGSDGHSTAQCGGHDALRKMTMAAIR